MKQGGVKCNHLFWSGISWIKQKQELWSSASRLEDLIWMKKTQITNFKDWNRAPNIWASNWQIRSREIEVEMEPHLKKNGDLYQLLAFEAATIHTPIYIYIYCIYTFIYTSKSFGIVETLMGFGVIAPRISNFDKKIWVLWGFSMVPFG